MDLQSMKAELSAIVKRGTTVDSYLEPWLRRAVRVLERTNRWPYMKGFDDFTIDPNAADPRSLALPSGVRRLEWVRILDDDGQFRTLQMVDPAQITTRYEGRPQGYWIASRTTLWFDKTPTEEYTGEWAYETYTTWSSSNGFEPWLFANAEELVLAQAVMYAAAHTKNDMLKALYEPIRLEAYKTLLESEGEFDQGNRSLTMQYGSLMLDEYDDADVEE